MSREGSPIPLRQLIEAYDHRFTKPGDLRESDAFYQWVLDRLSPVTEGTLLDVACGEGHLVKWAQLRGMRAVGLDFSANAAMIAKQVTRRPQIIVADGERLPFADCSFTYVTNTGSLEHFSNPLTGIREISRVLHTGGLAAIFLPNSYYLVDIFWHVWRTGRAVSHQQIIERFAAFRDWWELLESGGLKVIRAHRYNFLFPRSCADWQWFRQRPRKLLNLIVAPFIPFNLSYSFLYLCSRL